jgi:VanZ family protein
MKYGRTYDEADMVANTIGAFLGLLISPFIINRLPLIKKYLPFMVKLYR